MKKWALFWDTVTKEAARKHPSWEVTKEGYLRWLGGKGPRKPETLLKWYLGQCSKEEWQHLLSRIDAMDQFLNPDIFGELKPPSACRN